MLAEAGREETSGAVLYTTTPAMQQRFGLRSLADLPPIEQFELTGEEAAAVRRRLLDDGHLDETAGDA